MPLEYDSQRQADATLQSYGDRGVYVPEGMTAAEIMEAAAVLERDFEVEPYTSTAMVRAVLAAIRPGTLRVENHAS